MDAEPEPFCHHVWLKAAPGKIFMSTYTISHHPQSQRGLSMDTSLPTQIKMSPKQQSESLV